MLAQPVISARQAPTDTPTVVYAPAPARTYSAAVGFGVPDFGVEIGIHAHEVSAASFSLPNESESYLASPRYLASTGSLDFRWTWLRFKYVSTYIHVGPGVGMVLDRSDGKRAWGQAVRFGTGIAVELPIIRLFVDASQTDLQLSSGDGMGVSTLSGITVGAALH